MGSFNYAQAVTMFPLRKTADGSLEIDSIEGRGYLRAALHVSSLPVRPYFGMRTEAIARLSGNRTLGWALTATHPITRTGEADLRFSSMPVSLFEKNGSQVFINGGEVGLGKRGMLVTNWALGHGMSLEVLTSRRLDNLPYTPRWRAFASLHYDFSSLFNKAAHY